MMTECYDVDGVSGRKMKILRNCELWSLGDCLVSFGFFTFHDMICAQTFSIIPRQPTSNHQHFTKRSPFLFWGANNFSPPFVLAPRALRHRAISSSFWLCTTNAWTSRNSGDKNVLSHSIHSSLYFMISLSSFYGKLSPESLPSFPYFVSGGKRNKFSISCSFYATSRCEQTFMWAYSASRVLLGAMSHGMLRGFFHLSSERGSWLCSFEAVRWGTTSRPIEAWILCAVQCNSTRKRVNHLVINVIRWRGLAIISPFALAGWDVNIWEARAQGWCGALQCYFYPLMHRITPFFCETQRDFEVETFNSFSFLAIKLRAW